MHRCGVRLACRPGMDRSEWRGPLGPSPSSNLPKRRPQGRGAGDRHRACGCDRLLLPVVGGKRGAIAPGLIGEIAASEPAGPIRFGGNRCQILTSLCVQTEYFIVDIIEAYLIASIVSEMLTDWSQLKVRLGEARDCFHYLNRREDRNDP